jgi:calpain-15
LWVILLEKAWAKVHGTYARTESGLPSFAQHHCLGVPSLFVGHDDCDSEKLWQRLKEADRRNFTMIASSQGKDEVQNAQGIVGGHAYSVISVYEVQYHNQ